MATWASVMAQPRAEAAPANTEELAGKHVAVVDANAIIAMGTSIVSLGELLVTTEEVLAEIRDANARKAITQIPFVCRAPSDASLRSVSAFARKTGDLHQLSLEDLRLLALAHTLEEKLHGTAHLRTAPVPVKAHAKQKVKGHLPGWGNNGHSEDWDAIDLVQDDGAILIASGRTGLFCSLANAYSLHNDKWHPASSESMYVFIFRQPRSLRTHRPCTVCHMAAVSCTVDRTGPVAQRPQKQKREQGRQQLEKTAGASAFAGKLARSAHSTKARRTDWMND
jgi:hypothetical protein